jgi:hypothetical protein
MTPVAMRGRSEWTKVVDAVEARAGRQPEWKCLVGYYSVCVESVVSDLSAMLWKMYVRTNKGRNETYDSFLDLPAIVADGYEVIDAEMSKLERIKEKSDRDDLARSIASATGRKGK